jgi:acetyl-CoA synthetase (ADP-forming)
MSIIDEAIHKGRKALSEYESKQLLGAYGIPVTREELVGSSKEALKAADRIGYPVVMKGCSAEIAHKTERNLIAVDLRNSVDLSEAYERISEAMRGVEGGVLIQEMVKGNRELVIGLTRDPQFGSCVMFGLGGIFTEILRDVSFRVAPIDKRDALEMMNEIRGRKILEAVRGMEPVNRDALARCLIALGQIGLEEQRVKEIDVNPMIIRKGEPVAVDGLVVLEKMSSGRL